MLPRIEEIIQVIPFKIVCRWNTGEIKTIDLEELLRNKSKSPSSTYRQLLDAKKFCEVKLDSVAKTIYWENFATMIDFDKTKKPANLDFCPDVLYEMSVA